MPTPDAHRRVRSDARRPLITSPDEAAHRRLITAPDAVADPPLIASPDAVADPPLTASPDAVADRALITSPDAVADRPLITSPGAIAALASLAPLDRPATICLTLDDDRRPLGSYVIDHGTLGDDPDAVLSVAEDLAEIVGVAYDVGSIVLASVRPGEPCGPADSARLLELTMLFDGVGVDLLEWLVVHPSGIVDVRAATGAPSRW